MNVQTLLNWLLNNLQLLVVVSIFVLPLVGKMWQNVLKARAARATKMRAEQERIESLRTGRTSEQARVLTPVQVSPMGRREQMPRREPARMPSPVVRPGGVGGGAGGGAVGGAGRMRQIRLPGGIVIEVPDETGAAPTQRGAGAGAGASGQQRGKRPKKQASGAGVRAPAQARAGESSIAATNREAREAATAASDAQMASAYGQAGQVQTAGASAAAAREARATGPRSALMGLVGPGATREDVRKAFVMSEVLGRAKGVE
jgi:hypothetical protein